MAYTPTAVPDETAFTEGTTGVVPAAGEFNDASADVVAGKVAALRITKKRAGHVNLRDSVGAEFGTVGNPFFTTATGSGGAVTITDGADGAEGTTTDLAVTSDTNGTVIGFLRGLVKILASVWDSLNGRLKVDASAVAVPVTDNAGSLTVDDGGGSITVDGPVTDTQLRATPVSVSGTVAATQSGTWTVQPGNTANTTAWKVDASSVAIPITDNGGSLTVDGPLTDAQLRASVVPIGDGGGSLTVDGAVTTTEARPGSATSVIDLLSATDATRVLTILAANASRRGATIRNDTDTALMIREGGNASPTNYTDILPAGARYILDYPASTGILTAYLPQVPQGQLMATERS